MKARHFLLGATLLSAGLLFNAPLFAAVESDVVGYTTIEMQAGKWYQVGCPFVGLNGATELPLNDFFCSGFVTGDTLMILDSQTARYGTLAYWVPEANGGAGAWCDRPIAAVGTPSDVVLKPGQAVYIHKKESSAVTFSGKVEAVPAEFGSEDGNVLAQVAPVWPEQKSVNDFVWKGLASGDTMKILDSDTASYGTLLYWLPSANNGAGAWCDRPIPGLGQPSNLVLSPGQAVFVTKSSAGVATVVAP